MEGFNNLEQGWLLACATFATGSICWLAIIFSSYCLRQIAIAHDTKRQADAVCDMQLTLERIANQGDKPMETHALAPMSETGQRMATLQGEDLEKVRADRAERREARKRGEEPDA